VRAASAFVGFIAILLCAAPATVLAGRHVAKQSDVDWSPVAVCALVAAAGFLICRAVRAAMSRAYVAAAIRNGRPGVSPAFACTLLAWILVAGAGGFALATWLVYQDPGVPEPGHYRDGLADYPLPILFLFAGLAVLGAAAYFSWDFRRRNEIPTLEARGLARVVAPPEVQPFRRRTATWLGALLVDAAFWAGAVIPRWIDGKPPTGDDLVTGAILVLGGPGIIAFALLLAMIALWGTRRSAFDALRQRSSMLAIALTAAGILLGDASQQLAVQLVAGVVALVGVVIGSVTLMNIMERGSQPWLGFVFIAGNYVYGYLTAPDGHSTLPVGVTGWVIAVVAAGYAVKDAREHWKDWASIEPRAAAAPQVAAQPYRQPTQSPNWPPTGPPR
jgi:hypothetical protein